MFEARVKIMWEEQLVDPLTHFLFGTKNVGTLIKKGATNSELYQHKTES